MATHHRRYFPGKARDKRKRRRELELARLLEEDPRCRRCGLDVVELAVRRNRACQAYLDVARSLKEAGKRVPPEWFEGPRPFRVVYDALRAMGFKRPEGSLVVLEHISPLWRGGLDERDNLSAYCVPCAMAKTAQEAPEKARLKRLADEQGVD